MEIHEEMIADTVRTEAFRQAIHELVSRRIVVDVGAGTGILSIYAAEAGAKHVYAIEASNIVKVCKDRIQSRGLHRQIEIMHTRAEDVTWLQHRADVIVSEWIGYFLLFERMLPSVLAIRDRHLREDGAMIPQRAVILMAGVRGGTDLEGSSVEA